MYPWVTLFRVSVNIDLSSALLLYSMSICGHQASLGWVMILYRAETSTWWYREGEFVFKHTFNVSLL